MTVKFRYERGWFRRHIKGIGVVQFFKEFETDNDMIIAALRRFRVEEVPLETKPKSKPKKSKAKSKDGGKQ